MSLARHVHFDGTPVRDLHDPAVVTEPVIDNVLCGLCERAWDVLLWQDSVVGIVQHFLDHLQHFSFLRRECEVVEKLFEDPFEDCHVARMRR